MTRIQRSWALARSSWSVLRSERDLAVLPVLSWLASLVAVAGFGGLVWLTLGRETGLDGQTRYSANVATYVLGAGLYVAIAFVQTYFLAALCAGADRALRGRPTNLPDMLHTANTRLHRILPWAVVAATVSIVISQLERQGLAGRLVASLLGGAWNVLTFLTVPILVFEDLGPLDALKRSGALFRQTWGENLVAQIGFGFVAMVAGLPGVLLVAVGVGSGSIAATVALVALGAIWLVAVSVVVAALSGIYRTALYRYAIDEVVPEPFVGSGLEGAFSSGGRGGSSGFFGFGRFGRLGGGPGGSGGFSPRGF